MRARLASALQRLWYQPLAPRRHLWLALLLPLSGLFRLLAGLRRFWLCRFRQVTLPVPVIVVGNITVGGSGKTPLVQALAQQLQARGYKPGLVSRGYGGRAAQYPLNVTPETPAEQAGDEPLMLAQHTGCPVAVGPDRVAAARLLCEQGCDLIISDDGLQHYRLGRSLEIAVVDGRRGFGNGFNLPAGPLREPVSRLKQVDWVVINGEPSPSLSKTLPRGMTPFTLRLKPSAWQRLGQGGKAGDAGRPGETQPLEDFNPGQPLHAMAGIADPERFFTSLRQLGLDPICHPFPDHHTYQPEDLAFANDVPLVMTAKDAVKCGSFCDLNIRPNWWYLKLEPEMDTDFWRQLDLALKSL